MKAGIIKRTNVENETNVEVANEIAVTTKALEQRMADFAEKTKDFALSFVSLGTWVSVTKMGKLLIKDTEEEHDTLDVIVVKGETRYMLWGTGSDKGTIIVDEATLDNATLALEALDTDKYDPSDIQARYLLYFVTLEKPNKLLLMSLAPTGRYAFGRYAKQLFTEYDTAPKNVKTRISLTEKRVKNSTETYLVPQFDLI